MRKIILSIAAILCISACSRQEHPRSVDNLLDRVLGPGASRRIEVVIDKGLPQDKDVFVISSSRKGDKPRISASNLSSATTGIGWYLRNYASIDICWNNLTTDISSVELPVPTVPERRTADTRMRYYLNYCTFSYSSAFWNWDRWQKEIDWMALHGVNMPLMLVGVDCVWKETLEELGYTMDEVNDFVAGPGYHAWWLMGNLQGWGGPNPDWWYQRERQLSRNMLSRMRELGMEPVLPGYAGLLPSNITQKMGWESLDQGFWCRYFKRPSLQEPTNEQFSEMASLYYRHLTDIMGESSYYSMDPFHEGGNPDETDLYAAYTAINDAMHASFPDAKWVVQSWQENPRAQAQEAIPTGDFVILDLFSDGDPKWEDEDGYHGHDWLFCMLHNFGGRVGIHGRLESMMKDYFRARRMYPENLRGVGVTAEGIGTNPVLYDALYDLPWLEESEADSWLEGYVRSRYGVDNPSLQKSWEILSSTALACPTTQAGTSEPIVCARPSLEVRSASSWGTSRLYYDPDTLLYALNYLEEGAPSVSSEFCRTNLAHDIADLQRQTMTDECIAILAEVKDAYQKKDVERFDRNADIFLARILELDEILSTQPAMTYEYHAAMAESVCDEVSGTTQKDRDWMRWNLRTLITTWGPESAANAGGLRDYSNREWSGMLRDYYYPRWRLFFERLRTNKPVPTEKEWFEMESSLPICE